MKSKNNNSNQNQTATKNNRKSPSFSRGEYLREYNDKDLEELPSERG